MFITDHEKSQLQIVATDYRPMAEITFSKRSLPKMEVNFEEFISIKGIKAMGNQLTQAKIRTVNLLDPLPFEEPEEKIEEIEVKEEETMDSSDEIDKFKENKANKALQAAIKKKKENNDDDSQTALF